MKKILPILIISISLTLTPVANAQYIVFDPGAQGTRVVQLAKEIWTSLKDTMTAYNTLKTQIKQTITDPIMNALVMSTINQIENSMINWINSGFQGQPLLVINPDIYIQNVENYAIRKGINELQTSTSPNKNSIIKNIVLDARYKQQTVTQRTAPTLATLVRQDTCTDNNLKNAATVYVISVEKMSVSDPLFSSHVDTKKNDLYNSLCPLDKEQALLDCYNSSSDVCYSTSAFIDTNINNTAYGQAVNTSQIIADQAAKNVDTAQKDVTAGNGYISQKDSNGNIITPAFMVNQAGIRVTFGDIDRLMHMSGNDATDALLATVVKYGLNYLGSKVTSAAAQSNIPGINSSVAYDLGNIVTNAGLGAAGVATDAQLQNAQTYYVKPTVSSDILSGLNGLTNTNGINLTNVISDYQAKNGATVSGAIPDLNVEARNSLIDGMINKITMDLSALLKAISAYTSYISNIDNYASQIGKSTLVSCYTSIENGAKTYQNISTVSTNGIQKLSNAEILNYYNAMVSIYAGDIGAWKNSISSELSTLGGLKNTSQTTVANYTNNLVPLTQKAIVSLTASLNRQEITNAYYSYSSYATNMPSDGTDQEISANSQILDANISEYKRTDLTPMSAACQTAKANINQKMMDYINSTAN